MIADDHEIVLIGLKKLFEDKEDIKIIGTAADGRQLLEQLNQNAHETDVVITDIGMPDIDGLDLIPKIKKNWPQLKILVLSAYTESEWIERVFKLGADGFIHKNSSHEEIPQAIRTVLQNKKFLSRKIENDLYLETIEKKTQKHSLSRLSEQEYRVLKLIVQGKSNKEIAAHLSLQASTVSTYKNRIFEKFHVQNLSELIAVTLKNKIIH